MKVSIAMATYNGAKYLHDQLNSFIEQDRMPDELVVFDDGSFDSTWDVLNDFKENSPFEVIIEKNDNNIGLIGTFSKAIDACSGDIVFLSDQDDVWLKNKIRRIIGCFESMEDIAYVFSNSLLVDSDLNPLGMLWDNIEFNDNRYKEFSCGNQAKALLAGGNVVYGNTMAFRKDSCKLFFPIISTYSQVTHDTWISLLLSLLGMRGLAIPEALIAYRQHSQQVAGAGAKLNLLQRGTCRLSSIEHMMDKANGLSMLRDRVCQITGSSVPVLDDCISHLTARASMHDYSIWLRASMVLSELRTHRYNTFSTSWKSALKDLLGIHAIK